MDAREAIETAKRRITELFGEDGISAVRFEEIEKADALWLVTIGFVRPMALAEAGMKGAGGGGLVGLYGPRVYRVVTIDDASGEVQAIRIRAGLD